MTNPLIDKFYELHPEKKEKSNKVEFGGTAKISQEEMDTLCDYVTNPDKYSTTSLITNVNPNSVNATTAANHIPKLISYDIHSGRDSFLQIAEKVKSRDAKVTSVTMNADTVAGFHTGLRTITFEVHLYDSP